MWLRASALRPKGRTLSRREASKKASSASYRTRTPIKTEAASRSSFFPSLKPLRRRSLRSKSVQSVQSVVEARVRDPDLAPTDEENPDKDPPNAFWRAMSTFMYLVPWIDAVGMGREVYHKFPVTIYLYFASSPFFGVYYCSQFAPLIIFFLMFLAIVKNTKLSHFVRFNCMQAIMLDIAVMLFTILHMYFPAELRWSWVLPLFDMFSWVCCMATIVYCVFFTLRGSYADIPFISEAVYIQVELSEYA